MTDLGSRLRLGPILGDGAMGTMLQAHSLRSGAAPDLLNLENPDIVGRIHRAYIDAGADYIETNTFGAGALRLRGEGTDPGLDEVVLRGVAIARDAAGDACMVAGSIGPTGRLLEPYGDTPRERVSQTFVEVAALLERAGIDFFLVETMTAVEEACLAVRAVRAISARPVVATSVFAKGAKGYRNMMGESPENTALALLEAGASFVGTNCSAGMEDALAIMKAMRSASDAAVIAQPNAGIPTAAGAELVYPETPDSMARHVPSLLALGVRMIGGCCGTTPDHIRAMARALGRA